MLYNTNVNTSYYKHISSKQKLFDLKLDEVWQYRDLIFLLTKRNFTVKYKQTILGPLWLFITPLFTSFIHLIVFGGIAKIGTDGVPSILFYLVSSTIWTLFANNLSSNASIFTRNAHLFGKVYFPRFVMAITNVLSNLCRYGIQMVMVIVFYLYYLFKGMISPNLVNCLYVIPLLLIISIMGMSLGLIISSLTTKYRDLHVLVDFGLSLLMYATPIVYPLSTLDNTWYRTIILFNPLTSLVEAIRYCLLGRGMIMPLYLIYGMVFTIIVFFVGLIMFNKVERNFLDTI